MNGKCLRACELALVAVKLFVARDKNSSSNMKIDTLSFLNTLLIHHNPTVFHPHMRVLVPVSLSEPVTAHFLQPFLSYGQVIECLFLKTLFLNHPDPLSYFYVTEILTENHTFWGTTFPESRFFMMVLKKSLTVLSLDE